MQQPSRQRGMSMLSGLLVLTILAFALGAVFRMLPHYLDFWAIEKIIKALPTEPDADVRTTDEFYGYVSKGMMVNGIRDLDVHKVLDVSLQNDTFDAHLDYEVREPLFGNLELVAHFTKDLSVPVP